MSSKSAEAGTPTKKQGEEPYTQLKEAGLFAAAKKTQQNQHLENQRQAEQTQEDLNKELADRLLLKKMQYRHTVADKCLRLAKTPFQITFAVLESMGNSVGIFADVASVMVEVMRLTAHITHRRFCAEKGIGIWKMGGNAYIPYRALKTILSVSTLSAKLVLMSAKLPTLAVSVLTPLIPVIGVIAIVFTIIKDTAKLVQSILPAKGSDSKDLNKLSAWQSGSYTFKTCLNLGIIASVLIIALSGGTLAAVATGLLIGLTAAYAVTEIANAVIKSKEKKKDSIAKGPAETDDADGDVAAIGNEYPMSSIKTNFA